MNNENSMVMKRVISILLSVFMIGAIIAPVLMRTHAAAGSGAPVTNQTSIVVSYYSGVPEDLSKDSPAFDLTIGLLDPASYASDTIDDNSAYAALENTSFYGENTNSGTLKQVKSSNSEGFMKLVATFKGIKFNGKSNIITFKVGYSVNGEARGQTVSFIIPQATIVDEKEEKKDPAPPPTPRIVMNEYTYGDKQIINTKESFLLKFNYCNSSSDVKIENLRVVVDGGENFVIKNSTNTLYVQELGPKGVKSQDIELTALDSIKESSSYPVSLKFSYEYVIKKERKASEDEYKISVPVHKVKPPQRLTVTAVECSPKEIEPEEESTIKIKIANKGEAEVKNISVSIEGNFKSDEYVKDVGTLESGKAVVREFNITTLPVQAASQPAETEKKLVAATDIKETENGVQSAENANSTEQANKLDNKIVGKVIISYEDNDANPLKMDKDFAINVNQEEEAAVAQENAEAPPEEGTQDQTKGISKPILIGSIAVGVVVIGGVVYLVVRRLKKKRSELADEDI